MFKAEVILDVLLEELSSGREKSKCITGKTAIDLYSHLTSSQNLQWIEMKSVGNFPSEQNLRGYQNHSYQDT